MTGGLAPTRVAPEDVVGYGFLIVRAFLAHAGRVLYRRRHDESIRRVSGLMSTGRPGVMPPSTIVALAVVTWVVAASMLAAGFATVLS